MAEIRQFPGPSPVPLRESVAPKYVLEEHSAPKPCKYCVYDQTCERFVAAEVEAVNGSADGIEGRLRDLKPGAGVAVWIVPFQGISPMSLRLPVDLVFLDRDRAVLGTVESFPMTGIGASSAQAESVLALPADSLAQGEIRLGDKLAIYPLEEMKQYLQRLREEARAQKAVAVADPIAALTAESIAAPAAVEIASAAAAPVAAPMVPPASAPANAASKLPLQDMPDVKPPDNGRQATLPRDRPQPWKKDAPQSWWKRLLLGDPADPRRSAREPLPGLVAYFFTGGTPKEQPVRDISNNGIYIVTEERWFKGTIVQLTLTDRHDRTAERSITVNARAVREGSDGVALEFIRLGDDHRGDRLLELGDYSNGVTVEQIDEFLRRFRAKAPPAGS